MNYGSRIFNRGQLFSLPFFVGLFVSVALLSPEAAQEVEDWRGPLELSHVGVAAGEAGLVADQFGYVHIFWSETMRENKSSRIEYSRFDGITWSKPFDIYASGPFTSIGNISPVVDENGILHVVWSQNESGPTLYMRVPVTSALAAQGWEQPRRIDVPAKSVHLQIDSEGTFHLLYTKTRDEQVGIHHVWSDDGALTWSDSTWLDPDSPIGHEPRGLTFQVDDADRLHASWYYSSLTTSGGDWVRYARSLDAGQTWSTPVTIDRNLGGEDRLRTPGPVMMSSGQTVHIIWAAGELNYRNYRYSTDAGETWSRPARIFGNLNGQAFEGVSADRLGRLHFFAQLRFRQGIYHAIWDQGQWSHPVLIYLIRESSQDNIGDRIHAHHTYPAIRAGNQIVLSFTDSPSEPDRGLYVMYKTLPDVTAADTLIAPTPTAAVVQSMPTAVPQATATQAVIADGFSEPVQSTTAPDFSLWMGVVPAIFVALSAILARIIIRTRK